MEIAEARRGRRDGERGEAAVLSIAVLTVLLGMSALVIDVVAWYEIVRVTADRAVILKWLVARNLLARVATPCRWIERSQPSAPPRRLAGFVQRDNMTGAPSGQAAFT